MQTNKGDAGFLVMIIIFLVIIFILWAITGGQSDKSKNDPFIVPGNDAHEPFKTYGGN